MPVINNENGSTCSLQVSHLEDIPSCENFAPGRNFLIKVAAKSPKSIRVMMADGSIVTTEFYPGYNPEIVREILSVSAEGELQAAW